MTKVYSPAIGVSYIIYDVNKKGKKSLYSSCGRTSAIKEFCDKNNIDYSESNESVTNGVHYLEVEEKRGI